MERVLHEERKQKEREGDMKQKDREDDVVSHLKAMTVTRPRRSVKCYNCGKIGHIKWNCPLDEKQPYRKKNDQYKDGRYRANTASDKLKGGCGSDSESDALMVSHALKVSSCTMGNWSIDSGATCHMCGSKESFVELSDLTSKWR